MIHLAWGVFPDASNDQMSRVRGSRDRLEIYVPYAFYELYDSWFSVIMGGVIFITAQWFGLLMPVEIILTTVMFLYDLIKMIECITYIENVSPDSLQKKEFTWENFWFYPGKRFIINTLFFELPITISTIMKGTLSILDLLSLTSLFVINLKLSTWVWLVAELSINVAYIQLFVFDVIWLLIFMSNIYFTIA